jgi:calcium-dependent protein kinase
MDEDVLKKVSAGAFSFRADDWRDISHDAKDLIKKLLKKTVKDRINASEALDHRWIKDTAPAAPAANVSRSVLQNLKAFRSMHKMKKAALHVIAHQIGDDAIRELRDLFTSLDKDGNGTLTVQEMKDGIEKSGLSNQTIDLKAILEDVDADGSGVIDYTEWIASTLNMKQYFQEDVLWAAFKVFDRDGNGKISKDELANIVLEDPNVKQVIGQKQGIELNEILSQVDANGDGEIDFDEFVAMMKAE